MEIYNGDYIVYCHTNKINGKKYVGITRQNPPEKRWQKGRGYKHCTYFYNAIQNYGWENFDHEILASNLTKEEACSFEILLIEKLNLRNREYGYNINVGGDTGAGHTMSEDSKRKLSEERKGKPKSEETKQKISNTLKGRVFSEDHKNKISEALKGENAPWYGKNHSIGSKQKMSEARKGKTQTEQHKSNRLSSLHKYHMNEINPIEKYSINGELITIYRNPLIASIDIVDEKQLQITDKSARSNIRTSLNNDGKTAYGYVWRWSKQKLFDENNILYCMVNERTMNNQSKGDWL